MLKSLFKIKGQRGFGDSICLIPVVSYLSKFCQVEVYTDHNQIFENLNVKIFSYDKFEKINASYLNDKKNKKTNQFQDICKSIGLKNKKLEFQINCENKTKKNIFLFRKLYKPLSGIKNKFKEVEFLMPEKNKFEDIIEKNKSKFKCIQFGFKDDLGFDNIDEDITFEKNDYGRLVDLISCSNRVFTQVGHVLHLSEGIGIQTHVIFSKKGLYCSNDFINSITPDKVIFTKNTTWELDF